MATTIKNAMEQLAIAVILDVKNTKKSILGDNVSMSYNTLAKIENIIKKLEVGGGSGGDIIIDSGDDIFLDMDLVQMYLQAKLWPF